MAVMLAFQLDVCWAALTVVLQVVWKVASMAGYSAARSAECSVALMACIAAAWSAGCWAASTGEK